MPTTRAVTGIAQSARAPPLNSGSLQREAELLPVSYFHVVFTVPTQIGDIAYQNKAIVYDLLFKASAETLLTIGADPKHLGARLGLIGVLHTWGSALTHHPHAHFIVPGGGLSLDGHSWVASRPDFLVHVKVLSTLFRRLFLDKLLQLYAEQRLSFFGKLKSLEHPRAFKRLLARLRHRKWYVDASAPFSGPRAVLQSLSRYTHRVAIANSRLIACDEHHVTFKWKDYRAKHENRYKTMSLDTHEFIRRFLIHVLPTGFHRIRHYGFLGPMDNAHTTSTTVRRRLGGNTHDLNDNENTDDAPPPDWLLCPACGLTMRIVDVFDSAHVPLHRGRGPP